MRVILVVDLDKQDKVYSFTEDKAEDAINLAVSIYARKIKEVEGFNIYHLNKYERIQCYSSHEIRRNLKRYLVCTHCPIIISDYVIFEMVTI